MKGPGQWLRSAGPCPSSPSNHFVAFLRNTCRCAGTPRDERHTRRRRPRFLLCRLLFPGCGRAGGCGNLDPCAGEPSWRRWPCCSPFSPPCPPEPAPATAPSTCTGSPLRRRWWPVWCGTASTWSPPARRRARPRGRPGPVAGRGGRPAGGGPPAAALAQRRRAGRSPSWPAARPRAGSTVWRSWDEAGRHRRRAGAAGRRPSRPGRAPGHRRDHRGPGPRRRPGDRRGGVGPRRHPTGGALPLAQHAREWICGEVNRRLLRSYVDGLRERSRHRPAPVDHRAVVRRGGEPGRLRTDLRRGPAVAQEHPATTTANGQINIVDGVDLNRNFPDHWAYAQEGSSTPPGERRPTTAAARHRSPRPGPWWT